MEQSPRPKFFYGWVIVGVCFIAALSYGLFHSFGVFIKPLEAEFGWSRGLLSSVQTGHWIIFAASTFMAGWLTDRYGPRLPLVGGALLIGAGIVLCSQIHSLWQFSLFYLLASMGAGVTFSLSTGTVQRWFVRHRGLVVGIVGAGMPAGAMVYAPVSNYLISAYSWRTAFLALGVGSFLLLILVALLISPSPERKGLKAYGAMAAAPPSGGELVVGRRSEAGPAPASGWTLGQAARTNAFILVAVVFALLTLPQGMMLTHVVPFAIDIGITDAAAAAALGLMGASGALGRVALGPIGDRIGQLKATFGCALISLLLMLWLIPTRSLWMLYVFVLLYGFIYGGKTTPVLALLSQLFGTRAVAGIIGLNHAVAIFSAGMGPLIGGFVFDLTGSYNLAFLLAAATSLIASLLVFWIKPPPKLPAGSG